MRLALSRVRSGHDLDGPLRLGRISLLERLLHGSLSDRTDERVVDGEGVGE